MTVQKQLSALDEQTVNQDDSIATKYTAVEPAKNYHYLVLGKSGEGKTVLTKHLINEIATKDESARFHVIDLHGEYPDTFTQECSWPVHVRGFPFDWLKNTSDLPWDLHVDQKIDELKEAAPQLGPIQLGELRNLLIKCKKELSNKQLELTLRKHLSQSTQFQLEPLLLLLRANKNLRIPYGLNVLHDLSRVTNKTSQSIYAIALFRQLFNQAKFTKTVTPHYLVFEEGSRLRKAETTMDMLYQEGRKFSINGIFIAQSWNAVPFSVKQNSATMLLFPSAAGAIAESGNAISLEEHQRPLYKFNGNDGEWLEAHQELKSNTALISNQLQTKNVATSLEKNMQNLEGESVKKADAPAIPSPVKKREFHQAKEETEARTPGAEEQSHSTEISTVETETGLETAAFSRTKWIAVSISYVGLLACLATLIGKELL